MADAKAKKKTPAKVLKQKETVRERADKATNAGPKKRRLQTGAKNASKPFRIIGRFIAKILRPLGFVLKPFKTRPARFVGRVLASVLLFRFFRDAWKELRQVIWPDRRTTVRLTFAVFAFALIFGIVIALVDFGLDKLFKKVFLN